MQHNYVMKFWDNYFS